MKGEGGGGGGCIGNTGIMEILYVVSYIICEYLKLLFIYNISSTCFKNRKHKRWVLNKCN